MTTFSSANAYINRYVLPRFVDLQLGKLILIGAVEAKHHVIQALCLVSLGSCFQGKMQSFNDDVLSWWYGIVLRYVIPNIVVSSLKTLKRKCLPLSLVILKGTPNREIQFLVSLVTKVSVVQSSTLIASGHFYKSINDGTQNRSDSCVWRSNFAARTPWNRGSTSWDPFYIIRMSAPLH